jgi:electron transfer flavoprotein beta subunit
LEDLGLNLQAKLQILETFAPEQRKGGVIVKDVDELIHKLKNEAKVI